MNILFLIFNRPELQKKSFDEIRKARPEKIFIAADGPRPGRKEEKENCKRAREIVDTVDWPCQTFTLFRDENLGCQRAVGEAITWFFRHVERGVILEDDCIASRSFFKLADELLEYYESDTRVWNICGGNYQDGIVRGSGSYYFSRYFHCWGWATWRRCWTHYDGDLMLWRLAKETGFLENVFRDDDERLSWGRIFNNLTSQETQIDSWAYRWACTTMLNGGLSILPNSNLVTNEGFGGDGTHCLGESFDPGMQKLSFPIKHPDFVLSDTDADRYTFEKFYFDKRRTLKSKLTDYLWRNLRCLRAVMMPSAGKRSTN
jgi:hypothetical protein